MKFTQAVKMSLASVLSNKMRSLLTMLGIIIGIISIIVLVGIGEGATKSVTDSIKAMGTNLLTVTFTGSDSATLSSSDISGIKQGGAIKDIVPYISGSATVKAGENNTSTTVVGTLPGYGPITNLNVAAGRFITKDDDDNRYKVACIGVETLEDIYPSLTASQYPSLIGKELSVNGEKVEIIGILESKGTSTSGSSDNRILMPLSTAERLLKQTNISAYYAEASSSDSISEAEGILNSVFLPKFGNDSTEYSVNSQSSLLSTMNTTVRKLDLMLGGIAAISLLVGGIGIMNIMLVTVTERTREIGIRKAIGAKRRDIMLQFLIESIFLSCLGGAIGVVFGILICLILHTFTSVSVAIVPAVCVLSFVFSAGIGTVFGAYPANKASKLKPIEALRYE